MKRPLLLVLLLGLAPASRAQKPAVLPTIYGSDDRKDLYEASPEHRKLAESVAAFLPKDKFTEVGKTGTWFFKVPPLEKIGTTPLCPEVRFRGQPSGSSCTATLVAPRLVLTAAHCVVNDDVCAGHKIAFGYGMTIKNRWPTNFAAADLYDCSVVKTGYDHESGIDWALVSLDRPVPPERAPLKIAEGATGDPGTKIFTIGTPAGLPLKVAGGATIRKARGADFEADLDALGGNSGGAVFAEGSAEIIGVVIRSGPSFGREPFRDCVVPYVRSAEDVEKGGVVLTRTTKSSAFLPAYRKAVAAQAKDDADAAQKAADAKAGADKAGEKTKSVIRATGWIPVDEWPGKK